MEEITKSYNPKETESQIYKMWEDSGAFKPSDPTTLNAKPFSICIPPPNVTGSLHMGHALNATIQDILIRRARMQGRPTVWIPGTDHAGIATQNVVEKKLAKEGIKRGDLTPEELTQKIWEWVNEYGDRIINQLKSVGASCDWSRQRFTLDEGYADAVQTAFKHYYDKGWIYQGERVVNWCVGCQTAISDIEVEYVEQPAKLYYFKYDKNFPITIATTRPETKLGDTAVAVNPTDPRYKEYIDKTYDIDFTVLKRKIKIIADRNIDPTFGTGAVGVTPAHSMIDAEMAEKNNLESITVIDKYGRMNDNTGDFTGLKVKEAREKIIEWLTQKDLLEKTEDIVNNLSTCYRCHKEIEPQPSKQWFLKMSELIKPALEAIKNDEIKITPDRWKKVYIDWMENIRDWCISRQIIWGHKIPIEGSTDVLDTWFSSALWPFATLGWPQTTNNQQLTTDNKKSESTSQVVSGESLVVSDFDRFYPTTLLSTARDINMLWVVRMVFSGLEFTGKIPFQEVYVHPTVFNKEGKRMSKSLGTGVNPLELIEKYGADATRFGLMYINTGTQDLKFDEAAIQMGQKFANKLWNIARFTMMNNKDHKSVAGAPAPTPKTDADKKIIDRLETVIKSTDENLDAFRFGQAAHDLYDFVWHDLADIYIEESKKNSNPDVLLHVLINSLKLLHPFMPFVTESIWQNLKVDQLVSEEMLISAQWPK